MRLSRLTLCLSALLILTTTPLLSCGSDVVYAQVQVQVQVQAHAGRSVAR